MANHVAEFEVCSKCVSYLAGEDRLNIHGGDVTPEVAAEIAWLAAQPNGTKLHVEIKLAE